MVKEISGFQIPESMLATKPSPMVVGLVKMGRSSYNNTAINLVGEIVEAVFGSKVVVLPSIPEMPRLDWKQYDADSALDVLVNTIPDNVGRVVGIYESDLGTEKRSFVFGYGHMLHDVCVVSTYRLKESYYGRKDNETLLASRLYTTIIHELGHTFNKNHHQNCIMNAVNLVDGLDALPKTYCQDCNTLIREKLCLSLESAYHLQRRGGVMIKRKDYHRALDFFMRAKNLCNNNQELAKILNDMGVAYLHLGNRTTAYELFSKSANLGTKLCHPYYNLGILQPNAICAEEYFEAALGFTDNRIGAHIYIAKLYVDIFGRADLANKHLDIADKLKLTQETNG